MRASNDMTTWDHKMAQLTGIAYGEVTLDRVEARALTTRWDQR
jgi:hypothetical protein